MFGRTESPLKKEIRRILMGYTDLDEDGRIIASPDTMRHISYGVSDGATRVLLFGVSSKTRYYVRTSNPKALIKKAKKSFEEMGGRELALSEAPEAECYVIRSLVFRPAVTVFEVVEKTPVIFVYTGRGIFSFISRNAIIRDLEKALEGSLVIDENMHKLKKEESKQRRREKKAEKKKAVKKADDPAEINEKEETEGYDGEQDK